MIEHKCQLPWRRERTFSYVSVRPRTFKDIWIAWCGISEYTPQSDLYMDSMARMTAERKKHAALKHWWVIHPFSYVRYFWNILMTVIYLIAFVTIPLMICFVTMDYKSIRLDRVNIPIYAICWVDIVLNCFTGYYRKNLHVELGLAKIFTYYLTGFLVPDVLSSLPYDHITLPWRRLPSDHSYHSIILLNIMPLVKLSRYYTANSNIFYLFQHFKMKHFYYELCSTMLLGLYLIFWFSCLWYVVPILIMYFADIPPSECEDCWMVNINRGLLFRLKTSMLVVLEKMLASGYGLFVPEADSHIIMSNLLIVIGKFIECYILVVFLRAKADRAESATNFQGIMDEVKAFTWQKQLLPHVKKRLLAYYRYRFKDSYFREKEILASLSETLREEIALESSRQLIENVAIFKNLPRHVLHLIMKSLKYELYLPNEVIIKAGTHGDCMYFLSSGTVTVLTPTGKEICHLDDGAYFGEVALLVADQRRVASVIAIDVCEVYRLDRKNFRQCIAMHSELLAEIEKIAIERVEMIGGIEKQHKRFLRPSRMDRSFELSARRKPI